MTRALDGWRVLVPHGGDWGERVTAALARHGATAVVVPVIEFAPPDDLGPVDEALERLSIGVYEWLVVTSATTVAALAGRAEVLADRLSTTTGAAAPPRGRVLRDAVGRTAVAAVGPATAAALERAGVEVTLVPGGERSALGLVAEMPDAPGPGARVLAPHSDLAEPTLVAGLTERGWSVDDPVAYRTVAGAVTDDVRATMAEGRFDAVLLSSPSTVTNTLELVGRPPAGTVLACIGPRTRRAAEEAGLAVDVVPVTASAEELVDALAQHAARIGDASATDEEEHP